MSKVADTAAVTVDRERLLAEVRTHLPAFLGIDATEVRDPLDDVSILLNLNRRDLERVTALHLGLSEPIQLFVQALPQAMRRPLSSSERPRVAARQVRGPIDWQGTIALRAGQGNDRTLYIVRPAERIFDTPENQALAWALARLDSALRRVVPGEHDDRGGVHDQSWFGQIVALRRHIAAIRRVGWFRGVTPKRPTRGTRARLAASRMHFYRTLLPDAIAELERFENPSPADITGLLCQRYFEPSRNWQLFEVAIALRLARAFTEAIGNRRTTRLLVGASSSRPYAAYQLSDGGEIRLWYQHWPPDAGHSKQKAAMLHQGIVGGTRPDFIIQRTPPHSRAILLEAKATDRGSYLGDGLMQVLGYLYDRPASFDSSPAGWVVAPNSAVFRRIDPESGARVWLVSADDVAQRAVNAVAHGE